tara:strand:+ start:550 stop:1374 length:825 start_codon:yes stop_codon:yes gene_type:complete
MISQDLAKRLAYVAARQARGLACERFFGTEGIGAPPRPGKPTTYHKGAGQQLGRNERTSDMDTQPAQTDALHGARPAPNVRGPYAWLITFPAAKSEASWLIEQDPWPNGEGDDPALCFPLYIAAEDEQPMRALLASAASKAPFEDELAALNGARPDPGNGQAAPHPDDTAVDRFALRLKSKLAEARRKGRGGWSDPQACSLDQLARLLVDHVEKGDPVDIAALAMMLSERGLRGNDTLITRQLEAVFTRRKRRQPIPAETRIDDEYRASRGMMG